MSEIDPSKLGQTLAQPPTLSAYYADPKLKPASFFKAVRAAKIKAFQSTDVESTQGTFTEKDPDLSRTLALGIGNRPPEAVERWVIEAARSAVRTADPNIMLEESASADAIFERIVHALANSLQSKRKSIRSRAQNLVKLSLIWLIRRRSIDPQQALYALSGGSGKRPARDRS